MLLGAYRGHEHAAFAAHGGLQLGGAGGDADAFMTVITVFRVVLKVIGYLGPKFPQNISYDSGFSDGFHRIWPEPAGDIDWPRNAMALSDATLMAFTHEQPRIQT